MQQHCPLRSETVILCSLLKAVRKVWHRLHNATSDAAVCHFPLFSYSGRSFYSLFALFLFRALRVLDVEIREAQFSRSEPGRATAIDEREVL